MEGGSGGGELGGRGGYPLELTGLSLSSLKFSFFFSLFVYEYKSQSVHGQRARDQLQDPFNSSLFALKDPFLIIIFTHFLN